MSSKLPVEKIDLIMVGLSFLFLMFWGTQISHGYGAIWDTQVTIVQQYTRLGNSLVGGDGFYLDPAEPTPAFFGPIYPLYIGIMDKIFDPGRFKLVAINFVAIAFVLVLVRRATYKLTKNSKLALLAALLLLIWPDFMLSAARTQPELLGATLATTAVLIWLVRTGNTTTAIISGVAIGLAALTRSEYLALVGVLSILVGLVHRDWKIAAITLIAALVVVVPWVAYVSADHNEFVPVNVGGGLSLLLGIAQLQDSDEMGVEQSDQWAECCDGRADLPYWSVERDRHRAKRALNIAVDNPVWVATHLWRRWIMWLNNESDVLGNVVGLMGANWFYYGMFLSKLIALSGFGFTVALILRWRKSSRMVPLNLLFVLVIPIYLAIVFTPFRLETRYLTAAWPMIFITIAWMLHQTGAFDRIGSSLRNRFPNKFT
jgi:4-amino-4-deoxy-L-arabinose transferase-like glycosyltransferase